MQIFSNLVANDYKSHVIVNGMVTFWLISTSAKAHSLLCSSAKITFLLETNSTRHEKWVAKRSQLQSSQEQLQFELGRNTNKLFDDMKIEVERTRISHEKLHEKLHEKDNAILCVQMELGVVKANTSSCFNFSFS